MHAQPGDRSCANEAIGGNHFGPVLVYMSKVDDASSADGSGEWFKVDEFGYDASSKTWGTDLLNENCGKRSFKIPSKIPAGDYLVRAEAIALHTAGQQGGAQFYMSCYVSCFLSRFCRSLGRGFPLTVPLLPHLASQGFWRRRWPTARGRQDPGCVQRQRPRHPRRHLGQRLQRVHHSRPGCHRQQLLLNWPNMALRMGWGGGLRLPRWALPSSLI